MLLVLFLYNRFSRILFCDNAKRRLPGQKIDEKNTGKQKNK